VYDDLSKHAQAVPRDFAAAARPPGREAYPGDVFYLHSLLLERAAKLNNSLGGGSLTAAADHRDAGRRPLGLHSDERDFDYRRPDLPRDRSVPSGRASGHQTSALRLRASAARRRFARMRQVAGSLRLDLAQYASSRRSPQFGSDLDKATQAQLNRGRRLVEILKQPQYQPVPVEKQVAIIYAATKGLSRSGARRRTASLRRGALSLSSRRVRRPY